MLEESEFNTEASTGVEEPAKGEGDPANPEPQAGSPLQTGRGWDGRGLGVWNLGAQGRGSAGTLPSALWGWGAGGGGGCMPWCCQWELQVDRSWQVPLPPPASHLPPPGAPAGPGWPMKKGCQPSVSAGLQGGRRSQHPLQPPMPAARPAGPPAVHASPQKMPPAFPPSHRGWGGKGRGRSHPLPRSGKGGPSCHQLHSWVTPIMAVVLPNVPSLRGWSVNLATATCPSVTLRGAQGEGKRGVCLHD